MLPTTRLDEIFQKHHVHSVGDGYIGCICPNDNLKDFIEEIQSNEVIIFHVTL